MQQEIPKYRLLRFAGWIIVLVGLGMIITHGARIVMIGISAATLTGKGEVGTLDRLKAFWESALPVLVSGFFRGVIWLALGLGVCAFRQLVIGTLALANAIPDPNAVKPTPVPAGKNWRIVGSDTISGGDAKIFVTAATEEDARAAALKQHVKAKEVELMQ
jgi:hypothetical protein